MENLGISPVVITRFVVDLPLLGRALRTNRKQRVTLREVLVRAGSDPTNGLRRNYVERERVESSAARCGSSRGPAAWGAVRDGFLNFLGRAERAKRRAYPACPNSSGAVSGAVMPCAAQESWAISHKCKCPLGSSAKSRQQRRSATTHSKGWESWPRISGGGKCTAPSGAALYSRPVMSGIGHCGSCPAPWIPRSVNLTMGGLVPAWPPACLLLASLVSLVTRPSKEKEATTPLGRRERPTSRVRGAKSRTGDEQGAMITRIMARARVFRSSAGVRIGAEKTLAPNTVELSDKENAKAPTAHSPERKAREIFSSSPQTWRMTQSLMICS